ncbi:MAG: UDP-N-acetylglucosamine 2-epimerase [Candidatus Omnitrophica bacterium]|nr:UDP-N-acetylglucosamine 2-epimerase [Candidatus Omnitrophota bacterium]
MKLALIEKPENIDFSQFDKTISFCIVKHINIGEYATLPEIFAIVEEIGLELQLWLKKHNEKRSFMYRDVDILLAYELPLFDFLYNLCQKIFIVKKIIEKESPDEIWISGTDYKDNLQYPCLNSFLKDFLPAGISLKYFYSGGESAQKNISNSHNPNAFFKKSFLAFVISFISRLNAKRNSGILIYSDLSQTEGLFEYINHKKTIFLREKFPLSLAFYFLRKRIDLRLLSEFDIPAISKKNSFEGKFNSFKDKLDALADTLAIKNTNVTPYLKKYLSAIWNKELRRILETVEQSYLLFERLKITSLLLDEDKSVSKNILTQVSGKYKVKSYVNCHGEPFHRVGYSPLVADRIFVWSKEQKNVLSQWGIDSERIIVSGCIKYDKYLRVSPSLVKNKICKQLHLNFEKPVCLITPIPISQGGHILKKTMWQINKEVIDCACGFRDIQIIIKLHHSDISQKSITESVKKMNQDKVVILSNYDSLALAKGSDFLIACHTTFAIDAIAYEKPVILFEEQSIEKYGKYNVFFDGTTKEKLISSINTIVNNLNNNKNMQYDCDARPVFAEDKTASRIVADILQEVHKNG